MIANTATRGHRLLLSVDEAAAELGCGRSSVYELMASGDLFSLKVGRLRRVPYDALVAYVDQLEAEQRRQPAAP